MKLKDLQLKTYSFAKNYWPELTFLILGIVIMWVNRVPGTTLTGWDNHQSELDIWLNIKRSISGTWLEYQGLGINSGMAMSAELPKQLLTPIADIFMPDNLIRYAYFALMFILGPIGAYKFLRFSGLNRLASFVGGLFYMFNLHTLQIFLKPLEMFGAYYAALPWVAYLMCQVCEKPSRKNLLLLFLGSFFFSTAFITPTVFLIFSASLAILSTWYIREKKIKDYLKSSVRAWALFITANLYWLVPFLYFSYTSTGKVLESRISQVISPDFAYKVASQGTFENFVKMRNFFFISGDFEGAELVPMMSEWTRHLDRSSFNFIMYILFALIVIGIIYAIVKKQKFAIQFLILLLVTYFFWSNSYGPTGALYSYLVENSEIFTEIFRASYTKINVLIILCCAYGLGQAVAMMDKFFSSTTLLKKVHIINSSLLIVAIVAICLPFFRGELIAENVQQEIPQEYYQLAEYMKEKDADERILMLPIESYIGWRYYEWGYRGSGFLWYGIEQPIIDRAFDVWNPSNEDLYFELFQAFYTEDRDEVKKLLNRYNITHLLVDESIFLPGADESVLFKDHIYNVLEDDEFVSKFQQGSLTLYQFSALQTETDEFFYQSVSPQPIANHKIARFEAVKNDFQVNMNDGVYYPFANLQANTTERITVTESGLEILNDSDFATVNSGTLQLPPISANQLVITSQIVDSDTLRIKYEPPHVYINEERVDRYTSKEVDIPLHSEIQYIDLEGIGTFEREYFNEAHSFVSDQDFTITTYGSSIYSTNLYETFRNLDVENCWDGAENPQYSAETLEDSIVYSTKGTTACHFIKLDPLVEQKTLAVTKILWKTDTEDPFTLCFKSESMQECANKNTVVYGEGRTVEHYSVLEKENGEYFATLGLSPKDLRVEAESSLYRLETDLHSRISSSKITLNSFEQEESFIPVSLNRNDKVIVKLFYPPNIISQPFFERLGFNKLYEEDSDQDNSKLYNPVNNQITYKNSQAVVYDNALYSPVGQNRTYAVNTRFINVQGTIPKLFISDKSINLAETYINDLTLFRTFEANSLTFTLENRSFSEIDSSENILYGIDLYDIPYDFLTSIKLDATQHSKTSSQRVVEANQILPFLFGVTVDASETDTVLVRTSSYDPAWIAFTGSGDLLESTRINSWTSGWRIIPSSESTRITVLFIPQILQWEAYLLMIFTFTKLTYDWHIEQGDKSSKAKLRKKKVLER